jgi:hypothetical protein
MSKKSRQNILQSTPEIYHSLNCAVENNTACLVEDVHHGFYIFESSEACHIIAEAIHKKWPKIESFMEENPQTILAYHEELFKGNPPKDQDILTTAQYVWNKLFTLAVDRRPLPVAHINGRKSTIGLCEYRHGTCNDNSVLKTPQARTCYKLFCEALQQQEGDDVDIENSKKTDFFITEAKLRQYIVDHASELYTKQDPWRIFQYYRPLLISEKLITRK